MTKLYSQPLPPQVHPELPSHFRMPQLYLEAGAALLMAHRPADCMALCEEVVTSTLELLPEKAMLEAEPVVAAAGEKVKMLLWTGAAYLLQGHSQAHLKDWKQAVTQYTRCQTGSKNAHECIWEFLNVDCPLHSRCINLLVKVRFRQDRGKCFFFLPVEILQPFWTFQFHFFFLFLFAIQDCHPQIPSSDMADKQGTDVFFLQRMKALSLAGRGICFTQMDQMKEALRDLQLSLQALPGDIQCASIRHFGVLTVKKKRVWKKGKEKNICQLHISIFFISQNISSNNILVPAGKI